jgi:signal peptidase I
VRFVQRLVGLPGEEVVIKDGGIWINGARQEPPAEIAKLVFTAGPEGVGNGWGSPERPLRLGNDEHFVLGDFSLRSADSRIWGALPGKNIEGVVSIIYWPPSRWRLIR